MKKKYIHEIFYYDEEGNCKEIFDTIATKKAFKEAMIKYYSSGNKEPLAFRLVNSPNKTAYKIIPYINKNNKESICFSILENRKI